MGNGEVPCDLPPHARWIRGNFKYSSVLSRLAGAKGSIVHSRSASQSGVQVMSMQLGVPPIVSTSGALPEYQPEGLSITDKDDVRGLTAALDSLADPREVDIQARAALGRYISSYAPAVAAKRLLEIFEEIADGCSG